MEFWIISLQMYKNVLILQLHAWVLRDEGFWCLLLPKETCYGLNICHPFPRFIGLILTPRMLVLGGVWWGRCWDQRGWRPRSVAPSTRDNRVAQGADMSPQHLDLGPSSLQNCEKFVKSLSLKCRGQDSSKIMCHVSSSAGGSKCGPVFKNDPDKKGLHCECSCSSAFLQVKTLHCNRKQANISNTGV